MSARTLADIVAEMRSSRDSADTDEPMFSSSYFDALHAQACIAADAEEAAAWRAYNDYVIDECVWRARTAGIDSLWDTVRTLTRYSMAHRADMEQGLA